MIMYGDRENSLDCIGCVIVFAGDADALKTKRLPLELDRTQKSLLKAIEAAFDGVSREGGVSWREAEAIDQYASPEECKAARGLDRDQRWQDLIEDPEWPGYESPPQWSHLDPIAYRYYIPPALIRAVTIFPTVAEGTEIEIRLSPAWLHQLTELDDRQILVIERVAQFLIAMARRGYHPWSEPYWKEVLKTVDELRHRI